MASVLIVVRPKTFMLIMSTSLRAGGSIWKTGGRFVSTVIACNIQICQIVFLLDDNYREPNARRSTVSAFTGR